MLNKKVVNLRNVIGRIEMDLINLTNPMVMLGHSSSMGCIRGLQQIGGLKEGMKGTVSCTARYLINSI